MPGLASDHRPLYLQATAARAGTKVCHIRKLLKIYARAKRVWDEPVGHPGGQIPVKMIHTEFQNAFDGECGRLTLLSYTDNDLLYASKLGAMINQPLSEASGFHMKRKSASCSWFANAMAMQFPSLSERCTITITIGTVQSFLAMPCVSHQAVVRSIGVRGEPSLDRLLFVSGLQQAYNRNNKS